MKAQFIEIKGNMWMCPDCGKRYRKKKQCEYHIEVHPKKSLFKSLTNWFKIKDRMMEIKNYRLIMEGERGKKLN